MTKTYINNAIIGNSRMLGCLSDKGELVRLFWPNIDYPQHIERVVCGIFTVGQDYSTVWLNEDNLFQSQSYLKDTNILKTNYICREKNLEIIQSDFVLHDRDVLIRHYEITNIGGVEVEPGFMLYSSAITTTPELRSTLFDFGCDCLIHYRHGYYISISANDEVFRFQLGNNAFEAARCSKLNGYDSIGMMPDGAVSWKLGCIKPNEKRIFNIKICASDTLKGVKNLLRDVNKWDSDVLIENTKNYWQEFLKMARPVYTGNEALDNLYKRTILVFKLMSDKNSGGLLAAPEIDEEFTRCGRYAYCWGRDAAFITEALDKCGLNDTVDKFYRWAVEVQDEDGSWQQRYHMDGNLAPSWGMQVDETGTLIWGMMQHYKITGDKVFLFDVWESVQKGLNFLLEFIDDQTGLPKPSYDLWEERVGEHSYSSAAVYGGIIAGAGIGKVLDAPCELIEKWEAAAIKMKTAIESNFWKDERKCFLRSVRTKLNPWGSEYSNNTTIIKVNSKEYYRDVTLEDATIDISILGLTIPFNVFSVEDFRIENTIDAIERVLTSYNGGIKRYENDNYIGGNPWILTTLWVSLYYVRKKDFRRAKDYFEWAVKGRTALDLLPEQVNRDTGKPEWVIPLTWSHAMFVLVLIELVDAGVF
jgi:glucoamylase